jgi:hypothetical protein
LNGAVRVEHERVPVLGFVALDAVRRLHAIDYYWRERVATSPLFIPVATDHLSTHTAVHWA